MAKHGIYLTFDNTIQAMEYYKNQFGAVVEVRMGLDEEMNKHYNLPQEKLETATSFCKFTICGVSFICSDKLDNNGQFNDSFNIMMEFERNEMDEFQIYRKMMKEAEGTIIFDNGDETAEAPMYRIQDKYNLIWSFVIAPEVK